MFFQISNEKLKKACSNNCFHKTITNKVIQGLSSVQSTTDSMEKQTDKINI